MAKRSLGWAWRMILLVTVFRTCRAHEVTECDVYSVELQADFPDEVLIPCSKNDVRVVEALIHSIVQTDAIVGLNRMIPVPPFFLAFEEFGTAVTRTFEETLFLPNQMELSLPHLTTEDRLEDLYYAFQYEVGYSGGSKSTSEENQRDQASNHRGSKGESNPPKQLQLGTPPPLILEENSLRQGEILAGQTSKSSDDRRLLGLGDWTSSRTPTPTETSTDAFTLVPSLRGSSTPSSGFTSSPSSTTTGVPTARPSESPSVAPTDSLTTVSTSEPSGTNTFIGTATVSSSSQVSDDLTPNPNVQMDGNCEADWCVTFLTRPCEGIPHDKDFESTDEFKARLHQFEVRVEKTLLVKLRKWARDTNTMCLGNSWELKAIVKSML